MYSSITGKSLEYALCNEYMNAGVLLKPESFKRYTQYQDKFKKLAKTIQNDFITFARIIVKWSIPMDNAQIHLNADNEGVRGNVSDITITTGTKILNLSIKNNKIYEKSHRPPSFGVQAGLDDMTRGEYESTYKQIIGEIYDMYKHLERFNQIQSHEIKSQIYEPIYKLTTDFIELMDMDEVAVYFHFIIGTGAFYQCINTKNQVIIYDRTQPIDDPIGVNCSRNRYGHLCLEFFFEFRDPIIINMRLHTASSRITKNISLKFDACLSTKAFPVTYLDKLS